MAFTRGIAGGGISGESPGNPGTAFASPDEAAAMQVRGKAIDPATLPYALNVILQQLGVLTPATASATKLIAGAPTTTSFRVAYDVAGTQQVESAGLVVSANANLSSPVFTSTDVAPTASQGAARSYKSALFDATGLTAGTRYYYGARLDGVVQSVIGTIKLPPTPGTQYSFAFLVGSCSHNTLQGPDVYGAMAAETFNGAPLDFIAHLGDIDYSEIQLDNVGLQRDLNVRRFMGALNAQALTLKMIMYYMFSDHDSATNDADRFTIYATLPSENAIVTNARTAARECFPFPPTAHAGVLAPEPWDIGRVRFIMPDFRSQRAYNFPDDYEPAGPATTLGNGQEPVGSWDGLTWLLDAIAQAAADPNCKWLVLLIEHTVRPLVFDSWLHSAPDELRQVLDAIGDADIPISMIQGDSHQVFCEDGTNLAALSSNNNVKFPLWGASPFNKYDESFDEVVPVTWNGTNGDISGPALNGNTYLRVDVDDTGDIPVLTATWKGNPISGASPTTLRTVSTTDLFPAVSIANVGGVLNIISGEAATLVVNKTGHGKAVVHWASDDGVNSGTITIKPNLSATTFTLPYNASTTKVTLSSPVGCTIPTTEFTVSYYSLETEATALLAAMDVQPNATDAFSYNTLIKSLKTAGVWAKLSFLRIAAVHDQQAAKLDWISAGNELTIQGSVAFTKYVGFVSQGTAADILKLGWSPSVNGGVLFTQNSNCIGLYTTDVLVSSNGDFGGDRFYLNPDYTGSLVRGRNSSSTTFVTASAAGGGGHYALDRSVSTALVVYANGTLKETVTSTSAALNSSEFYWCGWNAGGGTDLHSLRRQLACYAGAHLTLTEHQALNTALVNYLTAVGAPVV